MNAGLLTIDHLRRPLGAVKTTPLAKGNHDNQTPIPKFISGQSRLYSRSLKILAHSEKRTQTLTSCKVQGT